MEVVIIGMGIFNAGNTSAWNTDRLTHLAVRHRQTNILAALLACPGIDVNLINRDLMTSVTSPFLQIQTSISSHQYHLFCNQYHDHLPLNGCFLLSSPLLQLVMNL